MEESRSLLRNRCPVDGRSGACLGVYGYANGVSRRRKEALAVIRELKEKFAKHEADGIHVAWVYAGLGEKDLAFAWLEKDFHARNSELAYLTSEFQYEPSSQRPTRS